MPARVGCAQEVLMGFTPAISSKIPLHFGHSMMCERRQISSLGLILYPQSGQGSEKSKLGFPLNRGVIAPPAHLLCSLVYESSGARAGRGTPPTADSAYAHGKVDTEPRQAGAAWARRVQEYSRRTPYTEPPRALSFPVRGT